MKTRSRLAAIAAVAVSAACVHPPKPQPPQQPATVAFDVVACRTHPADNYCEGMPTRVYVDGVGSFTTDANGYLWVTAPASLQYTYLTFHADGFNDKRVDAVKVADLIASNAICDSGGCRHNFYELDPKRRPLPPIVTNADRAYRVGMCFTFSGLMVRGTSYGDLPWFEAAGGLLNDADERLAFDAKHRSDVCGPNGDPHAMVTWASGPPHPVYNEPGNPYQRINTIDCSAAPAVCLSRVEHALEDGFVPAIFPEGDAGPDVFLRNFHRARDTLATSQYGDLNDYVIYFACFDSCFYGSWEPRDFDRVGKEVKASCPTCLLTTEMQTAHIPTGGGPADWDRGGTMQFYDALYVEFDSDALHSDTTWQVLARVLGAASKGGTYRRPSDQPASDDTSPPWYAGPNRGKGCMESTATYRWVRINPADAAALAAFYQYRNAEQAYLNSVGCGHAFN